MPGTALREAPAHPRARQRASTAAEVTRSTGWWQSGMGVAAPLRTAHVPSSRDALLQDASRSAPARSPHHHSEISATYSRVPRATRAAVAAAEQPNPSSTTYSRHFRNPLSSHLVSGVKFAL